MFQCTALYCWLVLHVCIDGRTEHALHRWRIFEYRKCCLKNNFAGISSFTLQQFEAWESLFLISKDPLVILPTGHRKSLIYQAAPDIASKLAARGFSQWEGKSIVLILTPPLPIIERQVEELNLKNGIKTVNLGNVSDEKLETHVRNGSYNFLLGTPEVWFKMKNGFRSSEQIRRRKRCCSLQLTKHTVSVSGEYKR